MEEESLRRRKWAGSESREAFRLRNVEREGVEKSDWVEEEGGEGRGERVSGREFRVSLGWRGEVEG